MKFYPFSAFVPVADLISDSVSFVASIKEGFESQVKEGLYEYFDTKSYYLYSIQSEYSNAISILALTIPEYIVSGKIVPHEALLHHKKEYLKSIILHEKVITKPIMTFADSIELRRSLEEMTSTAAPIIQFDLLHEGIHALFRLDVRYNSKIKEILSGIDKIYVADGHHRLDALENIYKTKNSGVKILVSIFPKDMISTKGFNRKIQLNSEFSQIDLLRTLETHGKVLKIDKQDIPEVFHDIFIQIKDHFYLFIPETSLTSKPNKLVASDLLSQILKDSPVVLTPVSPSQKDLFYEPEKDHAYFILPAITTDDIINETEAGRMLPAKSTWFEPKVRSGLIAGKIFE